MWLLITMLIVVGVVVLVALPFVLSHLLFRIFGKTSGLNRLAELYPASHVPEGQLYERQWFAAGRVYYKRDAEVRLAPQGLYLCVRPFLGKYEPGLIPWSEIRNPQPTILALQKAVRLSVGKPEVTTVVFTQQLFERIKPHLRS